MENYERDYSHSHCWDNSQNPCGIPLEKHTQCCLCDMKVPNPQDDLENLEKEFIDKVASNFLGWKLPKNFYPDCGISYTQIGINSTPIGTNLFTAIQTIEMLNSIMGKELKSLLSSNTERVKKEAFRAGYDCGVDIQCNYNHLWEEALEDYNNRLNNLK